jgi:hypothetical protein
MGLVSRDPKKEVEEAHALIADLTRELMRREAEIDWLRDQNERMKALKKDQPHLWEKGVALLGGAVLGAVVGLVLGIIVGAFGILL